MTAWTSITPPESAPTRPLAWTSTQALTPVSFASSTATRPISSGPDSAPAPSKRTRPRCERPRLAHAQPGEDRHPLAGRRRRGRGRRRLRAPGFLRRIRALARVDGRGPHGCTRPDPGAKRSGAITGARRWLRHELRAEDKP